VKAKLARFCGARAQNENAGPANWTGVGCFSHTSRDAEGRENLAAKSQ
jgi:hypothetical protein